MPKPLLQKNLNQSEASAEGHFEKKPFFSGKQLQTISNHMKYVFRLLILFSFTLILPLGSKKVTFIDVFKIIILKI